MAYRRHAGVFVISEIAAVMEATLFPAAQILSTSFVNRIKPRAKSDSVDRL